MLCNRYPTHDHEHQPFDSFRAWLPHSMISPSGTRPVCIGVCGEWKWQKTEFSFQFAYDTAPECCQQCFARKDGPLCYTSVAADAPYVLHGPRDYSDFVTYLGTLDGKSGLLGIFGIHTVNFYEDMLHANLLGIRQFLCGGAMKFLAQKNAWAVQEDRGWKQKLARQFR